MGRAKIDVTRLPTGCITVGRQQRNPSKKSRNPKLRWMGEVPLHEAVRSFITQMLAELQILPNVQLLAELKGDIFETTNKGGLFSFKGAYGRVGILLKWTKPGRELFVEVRSQPAWRKAVKIARRVFCYEDKDQFLELKLGPAVRRLAVTSGVLRKAGVPGQEIRNFIQKRLPTI
jgi:hypothetical protein